MNRLPAAGLTLALLLIACPAEPASAQRLFDRMSAQERAVKQMPLEQRPNRLGHFYGNNVRRMQSGRLMINSTRPGMAGFPSAARRYFYLP